MVKPFVLSMIFAAGCMAAGTAVVYQPASLTAGPYPSNVLTVPDNTQLTGLRVNMPVIENTCDPSSNAVVCGNQNLLNGFDGFSPNSRWMVCFTGPVNTSTLVGGIWFLPLNGQPTPIAVNQVIYDPKSNCAYGKPDEVLDQGTTYVLVVTNAVQDQAGDAVVQSAGFQHCLTGEDQSCGEIAGAIHRIAGRGRPSAGGVQGSPVSSHGGKPQVVAATVFTTMSATAWAQAARAFAQTLPAVSLAAGSPNRFQLSNVASMTWNADQSGQAPQAIPLNVLSGVGAVEFGQFLSANFIGQQGTISAGPTTDPLQLSTSVPQLNLVSYHAFLPAAPAPPKGYPVIIWGHGLGDSQWGATTFAAGKFAQNGFATIGMEVFGQGYGPNSTVTVTDASGNNYTEATPGRGVLLPGNTTIGATDGCILAGNAIATRDCNLQTVVDLSALVHVLVSRATDLNIDPTRIYYAGQSEGSIFGTVFNAVEPNIHAAVLSVGGATNADIARLAISARLLGDAYAQSQGVLNSPPAPGEPYFNDYFNDNYVYRGQAPVVNNVPGALAVQAAFESADWVQMMGDPLSFAPHLSLAPLPGVPPKHTLFLFSQGDLEVPNPANSALIRAAGGQQTSWYFQFENALGIAAQNGYTEWTDPHPSLSFPTIFSYPDQYSVAMAEQQQVASFFASNGKANPNPNQFLTGFYKGQQLFVVPQTLPEQLNYFQLPPTFSVLTMQ